LERVDGLELKGTIFFVTQGSAVALSYSK